MCGVTTRTGGGDSKLICKICSSLCCSCTHFVRTIKKEKVVKILNVGLKGRPRSRLKEIASAYQINRESTTASRVSPVQTSLVQRWRRLCEEIDSNNYIITDDFGMTLKQFQSSLGKAKKNQKVLRSRISENGVSHRQCSIDNPEISDPVKEEPTLPEEPLGCYILNLKGKKVRAQKCFNKIPKGIKREELSQNVAYSVHNNDPSAHSLACLDNTSTNSSKVMHVLVSCANKEEADLYCRVECSGSFIDKNSSISCPVDANMSSASTRDGRIEDICKAQMQDVDFFASENIVYLSSAELPPNVGEGTTENMLQPCSQESLPNSIFKACSSFPSHEDETNSARAAESLKESNILGSSSMNNVAPVCFKVRHEVTVLKGDEALSLPQCLFPIQSVTNQQKISAECENTLCLGSSERDSLFEVKASLDSGKNICLENTSMKSSFERIDGDDEALAISDCIPNEDSSPQKSTLHAVSNSLVNASSTAGEILRATSEPTFCPVEHFTSVAAVTQKRKASYTCVHDWKLGKHPRILLSSRKMISPKCQKRLRQAMYTQEFSRTHLSRLDVRVAQPHMNGLNMKCKSANGLDDSPFPLREKIVSKNIPNDCSSTETDAQKAVRFTQRQMHDIESLADKLLKKLKCMKNIVEETLCGAASHSTPSKYTDEEIRGVTGSVSEVEDGARRLLAVMARDCNRFCKIMNTSGKKGGDVSAVPKERKKIMFADEAGRELCHVNIFEDLHCT